MSTQTKIFCRLVSDRLGDPPVCISPDTTLKELVERMDAETASCAVVINEEWRPIGIITEQDVTRKITFQLDPETPVSQIMTTPVVTIQRTDYLYHAVAFMRRRSLRHIPVLNEEGLVCGMLSLSEALSFLSEQTLELMRLLTHEATLEGLRAVKAAQVELAEALLEDNVPVPEVQSLITDINRDIHGRILRRHLSEMESEKAWGKPPVEFSLIILGSGGRRENFLFPDQDNAFILDDYPDKDHMRIDPFFIELAERMTKDLDAVGLTLCLGYVMATNPVWRKTSTQWRDQVAYWMRSRSPATLRYCDIFFDFSHGYGRSGNSAELRDYVTGMGTRNPGFLKDMFAIQEDHSVALGWFGRLLTETDKDGRSGMINLKYNGTLPLVEAARLMALKHGIPETSTLGRLKGLRECDAINDDQYDYLTGGLNHLTRLLLRQQLADFKAEKKVTNFVPKASLSKREKEYLADCFRAIQDLRGRLSSDFSGEF
jgi:signal-transduction protein with cAMP-binding, CBS, and nucleotidyltransferase domain